MNTGKIDISEKSPPRYEFRTFGHYFSETQRLMEKFTQPVPEDLQTRFFNDIYIVGQKTDDVSIKVKNELLDIKKLINVENKLERWDAVKKYKFPIKKTTLFQKILPQLGAAIPVLESDEFELTELLNIAKRHKDLLPIPVHKKRFAYIVNYTICEYADIIIGNDYLYSVSVESTDPSEVLNTIDQLDLKKYENINYIQAIKRLRGLVDKPLAN